MLGGFSRPVLFFGLMNPERNDERLKVIATNLQSIADWLSLLCEIANDIRTDLQRVLESDQLRPEHPADGTQRELL